MIDWQHIESTLLLPFEDQMRTTPQSSVWHAEGDVLIHTQMVYEALSSLPEFSALPAQQQHILRIAALLHDIGKLHTTRWENNDWHAPHHAPVGSRMARKLLWRQYSMAVNTTLMQIREAVCLFVRYHSFPVHAIDIPDARLRLLRIAALLALAPTLVLEVVHLDDWLGLWLGGSRD